MALLGPALLAAQPPSAAAETISVAATQACNVVRPIRCRCTDAPFIVGSDIVKID
jgi:hypothetical protein